MNWKSMTRAEFDRVHAEGFRNGAVPFPWCLLTPLERIKQVVLLPLGVLAALVGGLGVIVLAVMLLEGWAKPTMERPACQKHAVTPYEYHQCR